MVEVCDWRDKQRKFKTGEARQDDEVNYRTQKKRLAKVVEELGMEPEMLHPVLTECFYGQKGGNSCETLIATMFKTWLEAKQTGAGRV